jgi:hypothetical protein
MPGVCLRIGRYHQLGGRLLTINPLFQGDSYARPGLDVPVRLARVAALTRRETLLLTSPPSSSGDEEKGKHTAQAKHREIST